MLDPILVALEAIHPACGGVLLACGMFVAGVLSPGPNVLAILGTSMSVGRREGCALALGIATGTFAWAAMTLFGLTAVLALYEPVAIAIRLFGGAYLAWLALKAFRSAARSVEVDPQGVRLRGGALAYWRRGVMVQMTNPKSVLFWAALMGVVIDPAAPAWAGWAVLVGVTALSVVGHLAYAFLFSTPPMVALYARARRGVQAVLGTLFGYASVRVLTSQ